MAAAAAPTPSVTSPGGAGGITVPPLGSLAPVTPPTSTIGATTSGAAPTATAGQVGVLGQAAAGAAPSLAGIGPGGKINPNDSTNAASQLSAITSANSPYIQQATQQGLLSAASRGLENSSLGAGAAEAEAVKAAAPLAEQNASAATQGALQTQQLQTQTSEFNTSQQAAAQELQAQLTTSTSATNASLAANTNQFNASQTQAAAATNAAATNTMAEQTAALTESMNQQDLSGTQAANLAKIQANSQQLIASNQAAASLYASMVSASSAMFANPSIAPARAAASVTALQSMTQSGLGVIDALNGMSLDVTSPTYSTNPTLGGGNIAVTAPGSVKPGGGAPGVVAPAAPAPTPAKPAPATPAKPATPKGRPGERWNPTTHQFVRS